MKAIKRFLLGLFIICCAGISSAQGIRAGANFSTVSGGKLTDVGDNNGWYVGVYKEFPFLLKDLLYLSPEIQYSQQGFKSAGDKYTLNYINVPIMAKIYLVKIISLEAGYQAGFKVGSSGPPLDYNNFDSAWAAGLGINLPFRISLTGRYIGSFNEVAPDKGKNQVWQAGLTFRFK